MVYQYSRLVLDPEGFEDDEKEVMASRGMGGKGKPLPSELDQDPDRADICLGTDNFHTPLRLTTDLDDFFRDHCLTVARTNHLLAHTFPSVF